MAFNDLPPPEELNRLLARTPAIQHACDLDLLAFLHRHPRTLLTSEHLAAFVGYHIKDIAKALDAFIETGLLARTQQSTHAARMFLLLLDGPQGDPPRALIEVASTREGRRAILTALRERRSRTEQPPAAPQLRLAR